MRPPEMAALARILRHIKHSPKTSGSDVTVYPSRDDDLPNSFTAGWQTVLMGYQVIDGAPIFATKLLIPIWVDS